VPKPVCPGAVYVVLAKDTYVSSEDCVNVELVLGTVLVFLGFDVNADIDVFLFLHAQQHVIVRYDAAWFKHDLSKKVLKQIA